MKAKKEEKVDEVKQLKKYFCCFASHLVLDQIQHMIKYNEFYVENYSGRSLNLSFFDNNLL
jgi:hypothetical protein